MIILSGLRWWVVGRLLLPMGMRTHQSLSCITCRGATLAGMFDDIAITSCIALVSRALCLVMAIFVLPETLKPADKRPFDPSNKAELMKVMNSFGQMKILNRSSIFRRLACTLFFIGIVQAGLGQVQTMYQRQELHFSKDQNGTTVRA